jgi:hypothetical protein
LGYGGIKARAEALAEALAAAPAQETRKVGEIKPKVMKIPEAFVVAWY